MDPKNRIHRAIFFVITLTFIFCTNIFADTELNGSIMNQVNMRLSDPYDLTKLNSCLNLKLSSFMMGENCSAHADLDIKHAHGNSDLAGYLLQFPDTENYLCINLNELYLNLWAGIFEISLGAQKVSWGRVDALAPTDNINPINYKEFDILDFSNMKTAIPMLKTNVYLFDDYLQVEGIFIPVFFSSVFPDDSDWAFYRPSLPETIEMGPQTFNMVYAFTDAVYPEMVPENFEAGLRIGSSVLGCDFSASYFYTWDDNPSIHQSEDIDFDAGEVNITLTPEYHRLHIVGLDFATAILDLGIRAEGAFFFTEDLNGEDEAIADPKLKWAIGADLPILDYFSINLQFSEEIQNLNFTDLDDVKTINSIIGGLSGNFFEETLTIMLGGICNIYSDDEETSVDFLLIPQVDCLYFDSLTLTLGAQIFGGDETSMLGNFDNNDTLFVKAKYSF